MADKKIFDWVKIADKAREAVAEGCVLLKNDNDTLPIKKGDRVSVYGRSQFNYYKSGTGSGGCVNAPWVSSIPDALKRSEKEGRLILNAELEKIYLEWLEENPFDVGQGWAAEPWNQKEMPLDEELVSRFSSEDDCAIIVIGRTAGEDKDNRCAAGSFLLTQTEEDMISLVTKYYKRSAVIMNTGNIIDLKWIDSFNPGAVMYTWQGGISGGDGIADVLTGVVSPSGHLADTQGMYMADYPASANYGDENRNLYVEDIYMGYRYFETFAPEKVQFPFGYGLSYTSFDISTIVDVTGADTIDLIIEVTNIGKASGKSAPQVYLSKPQGKLGQPARELVGFAKTSTLQPEETEKLHIVVPMSLMASYDDSGVTGHPYAYVAEAGDYTLYVGENVRDAYPAYTIHINDTVVLNQLTQACAPTVKFERIKPIKKEVADLSGERAAEYSISYEEVPTRQYDLSKRIVDNRPADRACKGDLGISLSDVYQGKNNLEEFLDQLSDEDLICMTRGEGMCSPKVTAGTASAFGGVTDSLSDFGIPVGCCADGPSGIRMDCGTLAFSMPSGTLMACTFNLPLIEELYELEGMDLRKNKVDLLLGPGINMHRHPLNGRNFEYFSEDPYLTGMMAAAQLRGMHKQGVSGTIKHYVGNEQEFRRNYLDSVISERALREIYLKPFELAVKEGGAYSIMTSYGALNGIWTAGNYDLNTTILRGEWGFTGMVMTDWWAVMNEEGEEPSMSNTVPMIRAQNDVYMVVSDSYTNTAKDNSAEGLAAGKITRGELLRNAANICNVLMNSPCMKRLAFGENEEWIDEGLPEGALEKISWYEALEMDKEGVVDLSEAPTNKGCVDQIDVTFKTRGYFNVELEMSTDAGINELAQLPLSVYNGTGLLGTISITSTNGEIITRSVELVAEVTLSANIKLKFGQTGIHLHKMRIRLDKAYTEK